MWRLRAGFTAPSEMVAEGRHGSKVPKYFVVLKMLRLALTSLLLFRHCKTHTDGDRTTLELLRVEMTEDFLIHFSSKPFPPLF